MKLRTVKLNASDNRLGGKYQAGATVLVLCDATDAAFSVYLPDVKSTIDVHFILQKTDSSANTVTIYGINGQKINGADTAALTTQYEICDLYPGTVNWVKV